jgi:hypothetical protein
VGVGAGVLDGSGLAVGGSGSSVAGGALGPAAVRGSCGPTARTTIAAIAATETARPPTATALETGESARQVSRVDGMFRP